MAPRVKPTELTFDLNEINKIASECGIVSADVFMITDGSGTTWSDACGWATLIVDLRNQIQRVMKGGMTPGTSYLAEIIPYLQALSWYASGPGRSLLLDRLRLSPSGRVQIHAFTDNETVAKQGKGVMGRRAGAPYWAAIDEIEREGYVITWHWIERNRVNAICDYLAGMCRKAVNAILDVRTPDGVILNGSVETSS